MRRMHWGKDVLGKSIQTEEGRVKIVGVIKDFNIDGFYSELKPCLAGPVRFLNLPAHRQTRLGQHPARELCRLDGNCYGTSGNVLVNQPSVSYTHLDGYKRQL